MSLESPGVRDCTSDRTLPLGSPVRLLAGSNLHFNQITKVILMHDLSKWLRTWASELEVFGFKMSGHY